MRLAIVGATGVVGREILEVLSERNFPLTELILVASEKSLGESITFNGRSHSIISLNELLEQNIDLALFSAGSDVSKIWTPKLANKGVKVIDNSSFWRMSDKHKLIVPEINGKELTINRPLPLAIRPSPVDNNVVIATPMARVISARNNSFLSPIKLPNTRARKGRIHGATTIAPITTAALLARSPRVAIRLAPIVKTTYDSSTASSPS